MKVVCYYRVSTRQQGDSGLGLAGQQAETARYCREHGATVVASYQEVESGKSNSRPELQRAIDHAKHSSAILLIAKLDRLTRNVHFVSSLMEQQVNFVACDNPNATPLTIHLIVSVAEDELRRISSRTKAALQAAKSKGVKLGSARSGHWEGREHIREAALKKARKKGQAVRTAKADELAAYFADRIIQARNDGMSDA